MGLPWGLSLHMGLRTCGSLRTSAATEHWSERGDVGHGDPVEIFATGSSVYPELEKLGIHDTASITMKYKSG